MTILGARLGRTLASAMGALVAVPAVAWAHGGQPLAPHDLWRAWTWDPGVVVSLVVTGALYAVGVRRLWRRAATGRGVRRGEAASFAAGWSVLALSLISPLHALGGSLFSAHMTQHELLMVVAAPLLVLGRPLVAFVWAIPPRWRRRARAWTQQRAVRRAWAALTKPGIAWSVHAVALIVWHVPRLYGATLTSTAAHAAQHVCFLGTALLFWWAMVHPGRAGYGASVVYLFAATILTGALGALLAFTPDLWYPGYAATTGAWGLTPIDDQQLGGVIMWVPGGGTYLVVALALFAAWLRKAELHAVRNDAHIAAVAARRQWGSA